MYIELKEKDFTKLEEPAQIIKNGGIVVFPTETVYGIGANALNAEAVKKIYEIKKRPLTKPINLLVDSIEMIEKVTVSDIVEAFKNIELDTIYFLSNNKEA